MRKTSGPVCPFIASWSRSGYLSVTWVVLWTVIDGFACSNSAISRSTVGPWVTHQSQCSMVTFCPEGVAAPGIAVAPGDAPAAGVPATGEVGAVGAPPPQAASAAPASAAADSARNPRREDALLTIIPPTYYEPTTNHQENRPTNVVGPRARGPTSPPSWWSWATKTSQKTPPRRLRTAFRLAY